MKKEILNDIGEQILFALGYEKINSVNFSPRPLGRGQFTYMYPITEYSLIKHSPKGSI